MYLSIAFLIDRSTVLQNHRLRTDSSLFLWGALIAFYWYQIFALESAVVEAQNVLARMVAY